MLCITAIREKPYINFVLFRFEWFLFASFGFCPASQSTLMGSSRLETWFWIFIYKLQVTSVKLIAGWRLSPACRQVPLPQRVEVRKQPRDFDFLLWFLMFHILILLLRCENNREIKFHISILDVSYFDFIVEVREQPRDQVSYFDFWCFIFWFYCWGTRTTERSSFSYLDFWYLIFWLFIFEVREQPRDQVSIILIFNISYFDYLFLMLLLRYENNR